MICDALAGDDAVEALLLPGQGAQQHDLGRRAHRPDAQGRRALTAQGVDQPGGTEQDRYLGHRRSQALEGGARLTIVPLEVHDDHVGPPVVAGELAKAVLNARYRAHVVMRAQSLLDEEGVRDVVLDQQHAHGRSFLRSWAPRPLRRRTAGMIA